MSAAGHQFDFGCGQGTGLDGMGRGPDWQPAVAEPREPTPAPPGSAAKIEVLAARYVAGEPLWHPNDETCAASREEMRRCKFPRRGREDD